MAAPTTSTIIAAAVANSSAIPNSRAAVSRTSAPPRTAHPRDVTTRTDASLPGRASGGHGHAVQYLVHHVVGDDPRQLRLRGEEHTVAEGRHGERFDVVGEHVLTAHRR